MPGKALYPPRQRTEITSTTIQRALLDQSPARAAAELFYGPLNTRKDTKTFNATSAVRTAKSAFSKIKVDRLTVSGQEALVFQPRVMADVHEQTELAIRCAEIIQDLRTVLVAQLRDRFDFKNYFFVANEIRTECLNQCTAAILQRLRWLRQKWNSLEFQLDLEALMINRLEKPAALISVNGKARPTIA